MTSPPDVQNVPDVWGLLEACLTVIEEERASPSVCRNIQAALAQRDRFVLVPKAEIGMSIPMPCIRHQHRTQTFQTVASTTITYCPFCREEDMLAAAPKPEWKL